MLGMARAAAVQLAELLDLVERHGQLAGRLALGVELLDAGQVQRGVEQHRGMAARQHEAIAAGPQRMLGIVAQHAFHSV